MNDNCMSNTQNIRRARTQTSKLETQAKNFSEDDKFKVTQITLTNRTSLRSDL